jgi:hypothetical protein
MQVFVGKLERKETLGRTTRMWDDNIKMRLRHTEREGMDCNERARKNMIQRWPSEKR